MTIENPRSYDFREGKLWVAIYPALLTVEDPHGPQRRIAATPGLMVSSNSQFRHYDNGECLTVRRRSYYVFTGRTRVAPYSARGEDRTTVWRTHADLGGGHRDDTGFGVMRHTSTYQLLDRLVDEACDKYAADVPDWHHASIRLAVRGRLELAEAEVTQARDVLEVAQAKRDRFAAALEGDPINADSLRIQDLIR